MLLAVGAVMTFGAGRISQAVVGLSQVYDGRTLETLRGSVGEGDSVVIAQTDLPQCMVRAITGIPGISVSRADAMVHSRLAGTGGVWDSDGALALSVSSHETT